MGTRKQVFARVLNDDDNDDDDKSVGQRERLNKKIL